MLQISKKKKTNNSNLDLVNSIACIKFGEILSICSHDNEQNRNSDFNRTS